MLSFEKQFKGKLKEVFFYITYRCNLMCPHCYIGDAKNVDMDIGAFELILKELTKLGASKITLLGGEPTLHPSFPQFIHIARFIGVKYIRLDTNGQFESDVLENPRLKCLNDICFSLDGIDPRTHGKIRSTRNYYAVINNIKKAVNLDYVVRVTMTVNSLNLHQIEEMASKLEAMGVSVLNLHLTSNNGRATKNEWLFVDEIKWINFYKSILPRLAKYKIEVKIPKRYVIKDSQELNGLVTCEAAKASRVAIAPDLKVYACPLLIDQGRYFAFFREGKFVYVQNYQENLPSKDAVKDATCPLLIEENYKKYKENNIVPLCVSYKQTNAAL